MKITKYISSIFLLLLIFGGCERSTEIPDDPGIPPAAPTELRIYDASDGEVIISWRSNIEAEVTGYNIYRRTEFTEPIKIAFTSDSFFFDDSLEYDTTYYYRVTAINLWERESDFSAEVSAKPENRFKPQKPFGIQINARNWEAKISIYIHWLQNEESDVKGYNIYRNTTPGFIADSSSLLAFTKKADFSDTTNLNMNLNYYYKVKAIDKGGLIGNESDEVNDLILEIPEVIFPPDNSVVEFFEEFIIKAIDIPASYRIVLQTNKFFGEIWSKTVSSDIVNDTLRIDFNPPALQANKIYYWRIATYSGNSSDPNSISTIFSVTFKY